MRFERAIESQLIAWKNEVDRKPLIINGARQVGKTALMKWFGKTHFEATAYFNFDEQPALSQFFEHTKDPNQLLDQLALLHGKAITPNTLLLFDEIQACPPALSSLKYFHENKTNIPIIAAGSLLGISLSKENTFPVGKITFLHLYPLTFKEFLQQADPLLHNYISQIHKIETIPDIFFEPLKTNFKSYLLCGGLPAVAADFLTHQNLASTDKLLQDLVLSYQFDFAKHPITSDVAKIRFVWDSLPVQLARENKKFVYQLVKSGARAREFEDALIWLEKAGLVYRIVQNLSPKLPLAAYDNLQAFKLYAFDIGVLRTLSKLDASSLVAGNKLFTEFKGAFIENYILQSLVPQFELLPRYWSSGNTAEVDFLVQHQNRLIPMEVKAEDNIKSKSLQLYQQKYAPELRVRFSMRNLLWQDGLLNIPHFLADDAKRLIELVP